MKTLTRRIKVARQISEIENMTPAGKRLLKSLAGTKKRALVVGITGSFGCGKSTLINSLIARLRSAGKTVGVLAIDPSSPKSGGALLGDRIRMQKHTSDKNVFIRSMATRGAYGGIAKAVEGAIKVLDKTGKDIILVETTGAGQCETAVSNVADKVVLLITPQETDDIQMMKAGILEIADIIALNKTDCHPAGFPKNIEAFVNVPVIKISALTGAGVEELMEKILCLNQ